MLIDTNGKWSPQWRGRYASAVIIVLVVVAVPCAIFDRELRAHSAHVSRQNAVTRIDEAVDEMAAYLDSQMLRYDALHGLAEVIALVRSLEAPGIPVQTAQNRLLDNLAMDGRDVLQVAIVDRNGYATWSTVVGVVTPPLDLSDRRHIQAVLLEGQTNYVSSPVMGRLSNRRSMQFAHRLRDTAGKLIGVSVVSVDPDSLISRAPKHDADIKTSLFRKDGSLVWTLPGGAASPPSETGPLSTTGTPPRSAPGDLAISRTLRRGIIVTSAMSAEALHRANAGILAGLRWRMAGLALLATAGALLGVVLLYRAERRRLGRVQQAVAEQQSAWQAEIAGGLPDMVVIWNAPHGQPTTIEFVSPASTAVIGFDPATVTADPDCLLPHPDDRPLVDGREADLRAGRQPGPGTYRLQRDDGATVWVDVVTSILPQASPSVGRWMSVYRDITERRALLGAVEKAERRLHDILASTPGVFYELTVDDSGALPVLEGLGFVSENVFGLTGYTVEELREIGAFARLTDAATAARRVELFARAIATGTAAFDYHITFRDGTHRHINDQMVFTRTHPTGGIITAFDWDVTEVDVLRQELNQAAKLAFLGEMAAGMAHELNQPLAAIGLHAATLAMSLDVLLPDHPALARTAAKVGDLVERAAGVIDRVRRFARNDAPVRVPFAPMAAIENALELAAPRLRHANVTLRRAVPPSLPMVSGDPPAFEQVILNLLGNAADAYAHTANDTPREVAIAIVEDNTRLRITISDRAGGLPPAVLSRLFEPFVTTKSAGAGTGLGLSICYRIITDMGGMLEGANCDGGARFTISLPIVTAAAPATMEHAPA